MPFITISTLFLLAGVFTGGCLVAWYIADRKNERQRAELEQSMTRALEKRYEVYEDLEQSFHRIFARMDEAREHWQEQMSSVRASVEGSLGQTTFVREGVEELVGRVDAMGGELHAKLESMLEALRTNEPSPARPLASEIEPTHVLLRVDNPELWDLERAYERRCAEQLAEISAKSQRVVELMDKLQALEPMSVELAERDRQYVELEQRHAELTEQHRSNCTRVEALQEERTQLVATNNALEETRRARTAELSRRIEELEVVAVEAGELRKQVESQRATLSERAELSKSQVEDLECKLGELTVELESVKGQHQESVETAGEARVRFEAEEARLSADVERLQAESNGLRAEAEALRAEHGRQAAELTKQLEQARAEHATAVDVAADERVRFEEQRTRFEDELAQRASEVETLKARIADLERRADALNAEVGTRDDMLEQKEARLDELQKELGKLQTELEQRAAELDARERKLQEVQSAWQQATGQVESQRTRLAAHLGSFHAAQEMLAQLKPMLEELETRLSAEDDDDGPTVIVSEDLSDQLDMVVNDGSFEGDVWEEGQFDVPKQATAKPRRKEGQPVALDDLPAALPGKSPDLVDEEADGAEVSGRSRFDDDEK